MLKGSTFAQIINVLGALYLAKEYEESIYGEFGIFISTLSILSILFTLNLDNVLVLSKNKDAANKTLVKIITLAFIFTAVFVGIIAVLSSFFEVISDISTLLYLSVLGCLVFTIKSNCEYYFTFAKKFKIIANAKIVYSFLTVLIQFLFFKLEIEQGLIFGFLIATFVILVIYSFSLEKKYFVKKESYRGIKNFYKEYRNLIRFGLPSNLINAFANHILTILIGIFFSKSAAGVYSIALKILNIPLMVISSSITQVYYQKAVEYYEKIPQELYSFSKKIIRNNVLVMLVIIIITNTIGEYLLELFFGKSYEDLGIYLAVVSVLILGRICFNPISSLLVIFDKLKLGLLFNTTLLILNLVGIYIGFLFQDLVYGITILSIFGSILYILITLYFLKLMKQLTYA